MKIDFKWYVIMMGILFLAMLSASAVKDSAEGKISIEAVKAGL